MNFQDGQSPVHRIGQTNAWSWPDRLCLDLDFDPVLLCADLKLLDPIEWTAHFVPQNYDGDWSVLPLRAPAGVLHPILRIAPKPNETDWEDTELLEICGYFRTVLAAFRCPLQAVRLMRLAPGSTIKEHSDHDLAAEWGIARLHIPVTTNGQVDFRLNGTRVDMAPGSTWYLRLADRHSVINAGDTARVHLVIDAVVNDWLEARLSEAMSSTSTIPAEVPASTCSRRIPSNRKGFPCIPADPGTGLGGRAISVIAARPYHSR